MDGKVLIARSGRIDAGVGRTAFERDDVLGKIVKVLVLQALAGCQ
jgi:hypothetical protein